jgi:hypothetical protein
LTTKSFLRARHFFFKPTMPLRKAMTSGTFRLGGGKYRPEWTPIKPHEVRQFRCNGTNCCFTKNMTEFLEERAIETSFNALFAYGLHDVPATVDNLNIEPFATLAKGERYTMDSMVAEVSKSPPACIPCRQRSFAVHKALRTIRHYETTAAALRDEVNDLRNQLAGSKRRRASPVRNATHSRAIV